jgi:Cys-tRNA(Pro)/Cys-tRNA(Cys) deacylase
VTPAVLALEAANQPHRLLHYSRSGSESKYGEEVSAKLGIDPDRVFKTLMAELSDGELVVCVVPVSCLLDLKTLAKAAKVKKASMAHQALAEKRTGYVVGGISPFGQTHSHRTFVDQTALDLDELYVSAGKRGVEIVITPEAFTVVLDATFTRLTGEPL